MNRKEIWIVRRDLIAAVNTGEFLHISCARIVVSIMTDEHGEFFRAAQGKLYGGRSRSIPPSSSWQTWKSTVTSGVPPPIVILPAGFIWIGRDFSFHYRSIPVLPTFHEGDGNTDLLAKSFSSHAPYDKNWISMTIPANGLVLFGRYRFFLYIRINEH